jgi:hypothetical protein
MRAALSNTTEWELHLITLVRPDHGVKGFPQEKVMAAQGVKMRQEGERLRLNTRGR